ncbi:50S ribosomal protein L30 [Buchnera aphidicola]|uniref:50S ribosomal protein L30 n=1 Tax=Buchnera aphidicola TaxID=9 RepID=UPI0034638B74
MIKKIFITQTKSTIGCLPKHKATIIGLGLRHIGHTVKRIDTRDIRGMINKVNYMVKVQGE